MSVFGAWAAPGGFTTIQKCGGPRPPHFWMVLKPPGAAQAPNKDPENSGQTAFRYPDLLPLRNRSCNRRFRGSKRSPPIGKPLEKIGGRSPPHFSDWLPGRRGRLDPQKTDDFTTEIFHFFLTKKRRNTKGKHDLWEADVNGPKFVGPATFGPESGPFTPALQPKAAQNQPRRPVPGFGSTTKQTRIGLPADLQNDISAELRGPTLPRP